MYWCCYKNIVIDRPCFQSETQDNLIFRASKECETSDNPFELIELVEWRKTELRSNNEKIDVQIILQQIQRGLELMKQSYY